MRTLPLLTVDVFTDRPFLGNPVAVVLDAETLDSVSMQRIARWTNLSETTFVLRPTEPGADYRVRIFTPGSELPFAGHPTLGSARAVLASGRASARDGRLVQQCAAGLVRLRVDGERLFFEPPPSRVTALSDTDDAALATALGVSTAARGRFEAIDVGPVWLTADLRDAAQVLALRPDMDAVAAISRRLRATGVTVHGAGGRDAPLMPMASGDPTSSGFDIAVRSFAPSEGVPEDPVCGSGNACVAVQRRAAGARTDYVAAQGEAIGRAGRISVAYRGDAIEVGGATVVCIEGRLLID